MTDAAGARPFIIIGENIHCTRVVKRDGARGGVAPDGRPGVRFPDGSGGETWLPLPDSILASTEFTTSRRIKHVMAAVRQGLAGGPEAAAAAAYVAWMAAAADRRRCRLPGPQRGRDRPGDRRPRGRHDLAGAGRRPRLQRAALHRLLGRDRPGGRARRHRPGLGRRRHARWSTRPPSERTDILDLCAPARHPGGALVHGLVDAVTGARTASTGRSRSIRLALEKGMPEDSLYVDALVIPIGVDPFAGYGLPGRRARHPRALRRARSTSRAASPTSPSACPRADS